MSDPAMVKIPSGVKVYVGNRRYRGEIPANICPKKYRVSDKSTAKPPKSEQKPGDPHD